MPLLAPREIWKEVYSGNSTLDCLENGRQINVVKLSKSENISIKKSLQCHSLLLLKKKYSDSNSDIAAANSICANLFSSYHRCFRANPFLMPQLPVVIHWTVIGLNCWGSDQVHAVFGTLALWLLVTATEVAVCC